MKGHLTPKFAKHILVTDLFLLLALGLYNLLSLMVPLTRIRIGGVFIVLLIVDICLVGIKLVSDFDFGPNRKM